MRLLTISSFAAVSAVGEHIESGLRYDLSGWNAKCDKIPHGCAHGALDVLALNNCLIDNSENCPSELDIQVSINKPVFTMETNQGIGTIMMKIKKPLFPGGWTLRNGTIRTPVQSLFPTDVGVTLEGSTLVFKEGSVTDLSREDLSKWTPLDCTFGPDMREEVGFVTHSFTCSNKAHELIKNAKEVHFAMLKDKSTPVQYDITKVPSTAEIILRRTTKASKITQISEKSMLYTISWAEACENIPQSCSGHSKTYETTKECIESHRKLGCEVSLVAYITQLTSNPIELNINGVDGFVEGVFIDPARVLFTNIISSINLKAGMVGYSFPSADERDANIYVSQKLGDLSGKLNQRIKGSDKSVKMFDNGFDIVNPGGKFVYLDRFISRDESPAFEAVIELSETSRTTTTTTTTTPTTTTTTTTTPTTTTTTTTTPTTTTTTTSEIIAVDGFRSPTFDILRDTKCAKASKICTPHMGPTHAKECIKEIKRDQPSCKITLRIRGEKGFHIRLANINGVNKRAPFSTFNLAILANVGDLVQWRDAALTGISFVFPLNGKAVDLYISDTLGGSPPKGKVGQVHPDGSGKLEKEMVPVKLDVEEKVYLDYSLPLSSGNLEAEFVISETKITE